MYGHTSEIKSHALEEQTDLLGEQPPSFEICALQRTPNLHLEGLPSSLHDFVRKSLNAPEPESPYQMRKVKPRLLFRADI